MSLKGLIVNPFSVFSPAVNLEVLRLEELHRQRVSESSTLQEGVLIMVSKLAEIIRLIPECLAGREPSQMDRCKAMIHELDGEEKILTRFLVSSGLSGHMWKGVIRFPYRLKRIGDMLESVLRCARIKEEKKIPFSDAASQELEQMFSELHEMVVDLREAFRNPTKELLDSVESRAATLSTMVDQFRTAHWERLETGKCLPEASSMYRDILDSVRLAGEYLEKMARSMIEMGEEKTG